MASGDTVFTVTNARLQSETDTTAPSQESVIELAAVIDGISKEFDAVFTYGPSHLGVAANGVFKFSTNYTVTVTET